ncbi:MAG: hypothetical protein H0V29_07140, partial [Thermoleophilaceae bacterium]|nr:hypothetical protein [Thermoleophilaceae bacterium]
MPRHGLTLLACAAFAALPGAAAAAEPEAAPGELIVRYQPGVDAGERAEVRAEADTTVAETMALPRAQVLEADDPAAAIAELEADPRVDYAEPNFIVRSSAAPSDTAFGSLWALDNLGQSGGSADADIDWLE